MASYYVREVHDTGLYNRSAKEAKPYATLAEARKEAEIALGFNPQQPIMILKEVETLRGMVKVVRQQPYGHAGEYSSFDPEPGEGGAS
jgi:hypothetical protein